MLFRQKLLYIWHIRAYYLKHTIFVYGHIKEVSYEKTGIITRRNQRHGYRC